MRVLNLENWKLAGHWPYVPMMPGTMETGSQMLPVTEVIDSRVPGSVYDDLQRAGIIEDPYYERNSLKCEWVKDRWWVYTTAFRLSDELRRRVISLVFQGIDYKAHIYLNGKYLQSHEGMYTHCRVDISEAATYGEEENRLRVVLEQAPDEMGQIGYTSRTTTQKARFTYKWDFGTRLVGMGLYDDVYVDVTGGCKLLSTRTVYEDQKVILAAEVTGQGVMKACLSFQGEKISSSECAFESGEAKAVLSVKDPQLWYPNGSGAQPLYEVTVQLYDREGLSDEKRLKVGLRTLEYRQCDNAPADSLPYIPVINGKAIYIKGVNCTPLCHMVGCVGWERYERLLSLARDANVNLIRVWGGGMIEKEAFYELCDEYGLMVWQEFIQSSSGIENVPSKDPHFLELLAATAETAVRGKREHVSLTFWSGGNELFEGAGKPSDFSDPNLAMLREITGSLDGLRLMLPTSASGPSEWAVPDRAELNHDIHGPWKYAGVKEHYALYNGASCQLHSEFGVDGMGNLETLKTVLSPENLRVTTVGENLVWRHHGEWWDTYTYRDQPLFGDMDDLEEFIRVSQFMQGEGLRYALEANRRRAYQNGGSIVWQLNEPWPNVSCTNLVDYYGRPKFAYWLCRDAMKPLHVSLRYDSLIYAPGDMYTGSVFVHDEEHRGYDSVAVRLVTDDGRVVAEQSGRAPFTVNWTVNGESRSFTAECTLQSGDFTDRNTYLYFILDDMSRFADRDAVRHYVEEYSRQNVDFHG